jgi:hypothetical protein
MTETRKIIKTNWQVVPTRDTRLYKRARTVYREGQRKPIGTECRVDIQGTDFFVEWTDLAVAYLLERQFRVNNPGEEVPPEKADLIWIPTDTKSGGSTWRAPQSERNAIAGHIVPWEETRKKKPGTAAPVVRDRTGKFASKAKV